jgi:hypothetical protein
MLTGTMMTDLLDEYDHYEYSFIKVDIEECTTYPQSIEIWHTKRGSYDVRNLFKGYREWDEREESEFVLN